MSEFENPSGNIPSLIDAIPNEERYWQIHKFCNTVMKLMDIRVEGREHIEGLAAEAHDKGAIITSTHTSWLDIPALAPVNDIRPMRFMAKQSLSKIPGFNSLMSDAGAYTVDRGNESSRGAALDKTVDLLNQGEWVSVYLEGTRNVSKDRRSLGRAKTGVARAALAAEGITPVVPIAVGYRKGIIKKKAGLLHAGVVVGQPLLFEKEEFSDSDVQANRVREITEQLGSTLLELKSQAVELAEEKRRFFSR